MLKIALPNKGRLAERPRELFDDARARRSGAAGERARSPPRSAASSRHCSCAPRTFPSSSPTAPPTPASRGFDLVSESDATARHAARSGFGRCRLVVAAREESGIASLPDLRGTPRVATVFPRLARRFFADARHAVEIVPMSGAAEIAPHLGIADVIVDLTSTGSTLRVNGLRELATVLESSARLIAAPALAMRDPGDSARAIASAPRMAAPGWRSPRAPTRASTPRRALDELVDARCRSVLRARGQRYVMANVPARRRSSACAACCPGSTARRSSTS